jgi:hypothetical protein
MIATIIRLPKEDYEYYKEYARSKGWSTAELFRKAATKMVKRGKVDKKISIWDLGTKWVIKNGPTDGSINHDRDIYEFEENKIKKQWGIK